jgi:hypothetical protein
MTLNASSNLMLGTTSVSNGNSVDSRVSIGNSSDTAMLYLKGKDSTKSSVVAVEGPGQWVAYMAANGSSSSAWSGIPSAAFGLTVAAAIPMVFATDSTERARITSSGNLLVGFTSGTATPAQGVGIAGQASAGVYIGHANGTPTGNYYQAYSYNGSAIGSITQNGTTGVLYNLTSDYRLKNNPIALTGASDFIMALQPKKWQWWDGSGEGVGFVAHEFMEVTKYSGNGEKDATEEQEYEISPAIPAVLDEEGNEVTPAVEAIMGTRTVPVYQSIQPSSSEVMANIVAFMQEQQAMINELKAKVAALEVK